MKNSIENFGNLIKEFNVQLSFYLKDKNYPLEERWDNYNLACDNNIICEYDNYGPSLKTLDALGIDSVYDYFNCERYESVDCISIIKTLEDNFKYPVGLWEEINLTQDIINEVKEEILERYERGFVYDW